MSTEVDRSSGEVLHVVKDGSLDVWTLDEKTGEKIVLGITEFWDEFNDDGTQRLDFNWRPIDNFMEYLHETYVYGQSPLSVAIRSAFGFLDVKNNSLDANVGYLYDGYWMTGESVGNRFAGKNAAILHQPWSITIMAAGSLHMIINKTTNYFNDGYFGETPYAGRQIRNGYFGIKVND